MTSLIFSNIVGFLLVISLYILPFVIIIKFYYFFKKHEKRKDEMFEIEEKCYPITETYRWNEQSTKWHWKKFKRSRLKNETAYNHYD